MLKVEGWKVAGDTSLPAYLFPCFPIYLLTCFLLPFLSACTNRPSATPTKQPVDLLALLPADDAVTGWQTVADPSTFSRDTLYNLVDGQAESFFAYGFEQVAVQRYQDSASAWLNLEIWQLATPADAFGLFTAGKAGQPVEIGAAGDADPGRRLAFWQDRYFISLNATQPVDDAVLYAFANLITAGLPPGGETPALIARLPADGLASGSERFFHEEISIQMALWLGGENVLGLSQATNGVLGRYDLDGETLHLILIEYPTSEQAADALESLQAAGIETFLAADVKDNRLAALFGKADIAKAQERLAQALK